MRLSVNMSISNILSSRVEALNSLVLSSLQSYLQSCITPAGWPIDTPPPSATPITQGDYDCIMSNLVSTFSPSSILALKTTLDPMASTIDGKAEQMGTALAESEKDAASASVVPSNSPIQDSTVALKVPEMPKLSSRFASVPSFQAGSNAVAEDYPTSYGAIDDGKNWFKVNTTTGSAEMVHSSGSSIKIDKAGNVSLHITGGLKLVVDKDVLINSVGAADIHSIGNMSIDAPQIHLGY